VAPDGFIAMDMETATTYGVASWVGMRRASILSVFDNPRTGGHIALTESDKAEARRTGDQAAQLIVDRLVQRLAT
jgi:purine-nucleoside phosphorylase